MLSKKVNGNCGVCGVSYHTAFYTNKNDVVFHCEKCWDRHHGDCNKILDATRAELGDSNRRLDAKRAELGDSNRRLDATRAEFADARSKRTFLTLPFDSEPTNKSRKGDAVIVVDQGNTQEQVYAHKFILSSRSPVFSKMFDAKMLEEATGTVHINDATLPVIRAVVKFCYDAEIDFTDEVTAEDVLYAANKYDITFLRKICEDHLIKTLSNENLPKRLKLSKNLEATGLEVAAKKYFKDNFDSVISSVMVELV